MAKKVLVTWNGNWADEMDLQGYTIMDKDKAKALQESIENAEYPLEISVGTNEQIEYNDAYEILSEITFSKISEKMADKLTQHVGAYFGMTNVIDYFNY